uniref:Docking protein 7 n=1 Tax=Astyanax mexicanus TaxID=7994 RepID=A0A3B1J5E9_ASTMX
MTDTVVVEGQVRLREGKKWKSRWVLLRKPSPVACLSLLVYKDRSERNRGRERSQATLGDICGLEALQGFEGMCYSLTILCLNQSVTLGFDSKENLLAWDTRISYSLGEHRFNVNVQPGTKLESGPAVLHLCNNLLVITRDAHPSILGQWRLSDLRRYGAVPNGFVFEGGTRCGYPGTSPCSVEERISQEASELEKRLSMLSLSSRHSSSSHSSYSTSLAGDDCSVSSSSSETSSRSDPISRLAAWPDPFRHATPVESSPSLSGARTPKPLGASVSTSSEERLYRATMGIFRPPSKPPPPRGLQDAGRQSSTDSGIATASHSSYSGSFSSYTGSLDTGQGETEEFGSHFSLSSNPNPSLHPGHRPLPPQFQNIQPFSTAPTSTTSLLPEHRPVCICPSNGTSHKQENQGYQVPGHVLQRYDSPRRIIQLQPSPQDTGTPASPEQRPEPRLWGSSGSLSEAASKLGAPVRLTGSSERIAPPGGSSTPRHIICPICGGLKTGSTFTDRLQGDSANYVNIPVSPTSKRQLHYMELDLQDVPDTGHIVRGASLTKYAHIDIAATEMAQRVGAQHAQIREERLLELEHRRRGTLN